jgi:GTP cyclohydrolase I
VSEFDLAAAERAVRDLLVAIGEDLNREGLVETPRRVAEMFAEILGGLREDPGELLEATFDEQHEEMIVLRDIPFYSLCEHHLLPFSGVAHVAYIPRGHIVGISRLARVVDILARRPQVQERLTSQIADLIDERLRPRGVAVVVKAEHLCYDRETEVLTREGWQRFDRLSEGIPVAQVDPSTLEMTFAVPTAYVKYRYSGPMLHWKSDTVDLLVTPDHRMVYHREWSFEHKPNRTWEIGAANGLPWRFYIPQAIDWTAPATPTVWLGEAPISGDDYARFMGAWIAEGCTRESKRDVVISQDEGPFAAMIWELLQRLPFRFRRVPQKSRPQHIQFKSSDATLYKALRIFGKSGNKYISNIIKTMSKAQISLFLDWYAMGDGHRYTHNPLRIQYVSKSPRLIDDVQELLLRVGRTGSVQRYDGCSRIETRTHKLASGKNYKDYSKIQPHHRQSVEFDDDVFCVSVPKGALLVRRKGKPAVSGNCMTMRGIKKPGSKVVTSATRGGFRARQATRMEFLALLNGGGE